MSHLQYMPGDPRLVDLLVCELKSKGIFDQFRKECIADVDTRPAYQNLRQRVESSVASFLARQCWKPDLNKNQLREKLRKHLLDGNYLEQGVERIVDQVVNPKVASVFIPQVEDLVYNYLGIPRKKAEPETSNGKPEDLLPTDLEAVSPGSVKSNDDNAMEIDVVKDDDNKVTDTKDDSVQMIEIDKDRTDGESRLSGISELTIHDSDVSIDRNTVTIPLPAEEIKLENIPAPENSPPNIKNKNIDLEKIDLPKEPNLSTDIPLPDEMPKAEGDTFFKPIIHSEDSSSSDSSVRRNVSPLTPIRNFNNENSCDAQQAFEDDSDGKSEDKKEPSSFRFTIETKSSENSPDAVKIEKKDEPTSFVNTALNINTFNTPLYDDSSNSNNLQIDYESDVNSKATDTKPEPDQNSEDSSKKEKKEERKSSHKSSHRSRDSHRHSSSKDKRSDSKHSTSRDSSRHDKKKDDKDKSKSSKENEKAGEKSEKKDSKDASKHRSSSSHKSSSKDKHRSSSSSKHSSKDERKSSSSSQRDKEKSSSKDKSKDSKSSRDKDRKSSSKKSDEKENKEKKDKKETDDHYSLSGRGNPNRRSTDRDSNDGSSSSKGSHNRSNSKSTNSKKGGKSSSKSDNNSVSGDSSSPSDGIEVVQAKNMPQNKKIVRIDTRLETPVAAPPMLPFVPDVRLKKPRFAANLKEAKEMMKMRKFFEEEQKRMNQEAALLLEFQANVRPSLSQVYSSIPGPELEFACVSNSAQPTHTQVIVLDEPENSEANDIVESSELNQEFKVETMQDKHDEIAETLIAMHQESNGSINREKYEEKPEVSNENVVEQNKESIIQVLSDNGPKEIEAKVEIKKETNETVKLSEEHVELIEKVEVTEEKIENNEVKTENGDAKVIRGVKSENEIMQTVTEVKDSDGAMSQNEFNEICKNTGERTPLHYFAEHEKFDAEIERNKFGKFLKHYQTLPSNRLYLVNCDSYAENLIKDVSKDFGDFEIVNYLKNGHLKLPKDTNIVKNVNIASELALPTQVDNYERPVTPTHSPIFSPVKSECSFELSSDYDAKLEEMVNKTSRKEIMEIILGNIVDESPSKMPKIGYCMDVDDPPSKFPDISYSVEANIIEDVSLKRKITEVETTVNNNKPVLTPNKLRKLSGSDQITSTTEEAEETSNRIQNPRSKYLGKAKRVGLPRPKKTTLPNSPSSDKSVENYEQNETPNGKIKTPRNKVQRYDTSDLYKPKLHYLSRRNNIS